MHNSIIFLIHSTVVGVCTLAAMRGGKTLIHCWLCLLAVMMNILIRKEITLFGLNATCCDALSIGYLLGLNFVQEFFGRHEAYKVMISSFMMSVAVALLGLFHIAYLPNCHDVASMHYDAILGIAPRILLASLISFVLVQRVDVIFFAFLKRKIPAYFSIRSTLSLILGNTLDTIIFTFLGLYGVVSSCTEIIYCSWMIKMLGITLTLPLVTKKIYGTFSIRNFTSV